MAKIKLRVVRGVMFNREHQKPGTILELEAESGETLNLLASGRLEQVVEAPKPAKSAEPEKPKA